MYASTCLVAKSEFQSCLAQVGGANWFMKQSRLAKLVFLTSCRNSQQLWLGTVYSQDLDRKSGENYKRRPLSSGLRHQSQYYCPGMNSFSFSDGRHGTQLRKRMSWYWRLTLSIESTRAAGPTRERDRLELNLAMTSAASWPSCSTLFMIMYICTKEMPPKISPRDLAGTQRGFLKFIYRSSTSAIIMCHSSNLWLTHQATLIGIHSRASSITQAAILRSDIFRASSSTNIVRSSQRLIVGLKDEQRK